MTKRTRLFVLIASSVLAVGLGTGLLASYMGFGSLALLAADGPAELAYIPPTAQVVAFANVRDVMTSELRERFRQNHPAQTPGDVDPEGREGIQAQTGINFETDIDHVVAALLGNGQAEGPQRPLLLARGRFDEVRIEGVMRERGAVVETYKNERVIAIADGDLALAFVEPGLIVAGSHGSVRTAIDTKAGRSSVTDNPEVMGLIRTLDDGNAWAVGRFDAIVRGGGLPSQITSQLPPINWFSASGHINGGIRATVRAETRDDGAGQNLRDVIRGFVALGRLQAGQHEGLASVLDSIELGGEGKSVALSFSLSPEALDMLGAAAAAGRGAGSRRERAPASPAPSGAAPNPILGPPASDGVAHAAGAL